MYFNEYFNGDEEYSYVDKPQLNYDNRALSLISDLIISSSTQGDMMIYGDILSYQAQQEDDMMVDENEFQSLAAAFGLSTRNDITRSCLT